MRWALVAVTGFTAVARAQDADSLKAVSQFRSRYLFGDWLGVRTALERRGITVAVITITDPFWNASGGLRRGVTDYSLIGVDVVMRTDQLLGWHGGALHIGFAANFGNPLSANYVGNAFPVQLADVADAYPRLTYLGYTQSILDDKLSVRVGRLTINSVYGEEFLASAYFKAFTSVGIDLVPLGVFFNAPGAFGYPDATWGARIKFKPVDQFYAMVGAYNGDPRLKDGARGGVDFSMRGPAFVIGEVGFQPDSSGNVKLGGYYNGASDSARVHYGLYVLGDQMLFHRLGAFGAFTYATNPRVDRVPYFFDAGLVLYGPFGPRAKDFTGFAAAYGSYSRDLPLTDEAALEWMYGFAIRPGLLVQPDLQYLIHPSGTRAIPNAVAFGANIVVNW